MPPRLTLRSLLAPLAVFVLTACARGSSRVGPEQIPQLEEQLADRPDHPDLRVRLGVAYYRANRPADAAETLADVAGRPDASGVAHLYLGLAREALEDWSGAREAYSDYLETGREGPLVDDIRDRVTYLARRRATSEARSALEREDEISVERPEPRSVAVLPYRPIVDDADLEPLGVALADMMITDFALAGGLTVLERSRIQALLNEMDLAEAGYTEPATAARAGRLLRAEHVVQGAMASVGRERLRIDTDLRHTGRRESTARVTGEEGLGELFDLEKRTVFDVLDALGAELTPAEREAINENRTESLLAFLAYGDGLRALDRADWVRARERFERAAEIDPGFDRARERAAEAGRLERAAALDDEDLARRVRAATSGGPRGAGQPAVGGASTDMLRQTVGRTNPSRGGNLLGRGLPGSGFDEQSDRRDPLQEALGTDDLSDPLLGTIDLVVRRPSGGEQQ